MLVDAPFVWKNVRLILNSLTLYLERCFFPDCSERCKDLLATLAAQINI